MMYGNLAEEGCIVKTAGVDRSIWYFEGPARLFQSQEEACEAILGDRISPGDVVVIPAGIAQQVTNNGRSDLIFYCICTPRFTPDCYESLE